MNKCSRSLSPYFYEDALFNPCFRYCFNTGCPVDLLLVSFPEYVDWFRVCEAYNFKSIDKHLLKNIIYIISQSKDSVDSIFSKYVLVGTFHPICMTLGEMILKTIKKEVDIRERN